jgi:hypothetical protein
MLPADLLLLTLPLGALSRARAGPGKSQRQNQFCGGPGGV